MNIDINSFLVGLSILVTIGMGLTAIIWKMLNDNIKQQEKTIDELKSALIKERESTQSVIKEIFGKIERASEHYEERHGEDFRRLQNTQDKLQEKVSDIEVTVANMGSIYITRSELRPESQR